MPDGQLFTQQAATRKANVVKTSLAAGKLRLVKDAITFNVYTTKEALEAAECDFDGYPVGGYDLATWSGPVNDPQGGAVLTSPLVPVAYGPAADPPVGNAVFGWWVEDSTGAVRMVGYYNPARPMQAVGDGFAWVDQMVEARNPQVVAVE